MTTETTTKTARPPIVESEACAAERRKLAAALGLTEAEAHELNISEEAYNTEDLDKDVETMKRLGYWK